MQEQMQGRGPATGFRGGFPLLSPHSRALPGGPNGVSARPRRGSRPCPGRWAGEARPPGSATPIRSAQSPPCWGPGMQARRDWGLPRWAAPGLCSPRSDSGGSSPTRTRGAPARIPSTRASGCEEGSPAVPRLGPTTGKRGAPSQAQHAAVRAQSAAKSCWGWGWGLPKFLGTFRLEIPQPCSAPYRKRRPGRAVAPYDPRLLAAARPRPPGALAKL